MLFTDRAEAGRLLASRLSHLRGRDVVVLGLPRGGVPVAYEVAVALGAPLDVLVVRKLGLPFQPELAMGAIGEDGVRVLNERVLTDAWVSREDLEAVERHEREVLAERVARIRDHQARLPLTGRTALVIDDGVATGSTARAACRIARAHGAARVVLATPVAPAESAHLLERDADEVACLHTPAHFAAIGQFYADFSPTTDEQVIALLALANTRGVPEARRAPDDVAGPATGESDAHGRDEDVTVATGDAHLEGHLTVPEGARGLVLFAHGSGSSRHSPRNRFVASVLTRAGLGTLLLDLLTSAEEGDRGNVFDIALLAGRLVGATAWLRDDPGTAGLALGYFGASTGAGAALWAAAEPDADVAAVVSRGGRPDLAGPRLADVRAPTLLVVGARDTVVLQLNREAQAMMRCETRLAVVPGATHLFEEPGALRTAADLARQWFTAHLTAVTPR